MRDNLARIFRIVFSKRNLHPIFRMRRRPAMPLPHFLVLIAAVILVAALTLWAAFSAGAPVVVLAMVTLSAAAALHLSQGDRHDHDA